MKTKIFKHAYFIAFIVTLIACSTKRDTFLSRNSHALSTRDNILYNGQIGLDKGIQDVKAGAKDNFWKRLPIEKLQITDDDATTKTKNPNFELAEAKATKAIQKHSMNIGGQERNYQIDEAHMLLGKARYYDQRFLPALDAFNYILYKYPNSNNIYQAKIWREKANMRLGNDVQVIKNISKLLDEKAKEKKKKNGKKFIKQVVGDANALLAQSFLNVEEKDSAIVKLKAAEKFTKINSERVRYRFILGQLYQELGVQDTAIYYYQLVIDSNRKAKRELIIQAHAKKAQLFDYQNGDRNAFVKTFDKLVEDRENRPFLDVIYHEMGVFYDKQNDQKLAKYYYNSSLKRNSPDRYLVASNYRNLGNLHFKNTEYAKAAKFYDSTLVKLDVKTREHIHIKKVRKDLDEVIEFESIASETDSILNIMALSNTNRILFFEKHIENLKKSDEAKKIAQEKQEETHAEIEKNNINNSNDVVVSRQREKKASLTPPSSPIYTDDNVISDFYFYNPATVAFGKLEFKKKFGNRMLGGNWRISSIKPTEIESVINDSTFSVKTEVDEILERYTTQFYLDQLPKTQTEIDYLTKKRNFTNYQLGVIYKEKFKEYPLATKKLEQLLQSNPEEKLVAPTMYNLYKIYQITNQDKVNEMKSSILNQFPDSRYAQILNNKQASAVTIESPEATYEKWYRLYQEEHFTEVLSKLDELIAQYSGDEIVPKFEMLKANILGKLQGLQAYKNAIQYVADNYSTSDEGKNAIEILTNQIPILERMSFNSRDTKNWKILYKVGKAEDKNTKILEEKIKKFIASENIQKMSYSFDVYTEKDNFLTISGINSESYAKNTADIMKTDKAYKVPEMAVVLSNENYKLVQIKKNLEEYLALPKVSSVEEPAVIPDSQETK